MATTVYERKNITRSVGVPSIEEGKQPPHDYTHATRRMPTESFFLISTQVKVIRSGPLVPECIENIPYVLIRLRMQNITHTHTPHWRAPCIEFGTHGPVKRPCCLWIDLDGWVLCAVNLYFARSLLQYKLVYDEVGLLRCLMRSATVQKWCGAAMTLLQHTV